MKKVICAMSGGVDSSVAAALLKNQGYDVAGVFMVFGTGEAGKENRCCSIESEEDARKVAAKLKIPFYVMDFREEFRARVVDYFLKEYAEGRTPNPCVECNKFIKFGLLLDKALSLGADFVATGHYVTFGRRTSTCDVDVRRRRATSESLLRAKDKEKDQSYFLWTLTQSQLKKVLFPIGEYSKSEVRKMAEEFDLPVSQKKESQEICFVNSDLTEFLASRIKAKRGPIITTEGEKIGEHQGLPFYTIGQRKDIGVGGSGPYYVVEKDLKKNTLIVTPYDYNEGLWRKDLVAESVNWISGKEPRMPLEVEAQIRYRHDSVPAVVSRSKKIGSYKVKFEEPQRAVTPGQSVVFYQGDIVLGGGVIA